MYCFILKNRDNHIFHGSKTLFETPSIAVCSRVEAD